MDYLQGNIRIADPDEKGSFKTFYPYTTIDQIIGSLENGESLSTVISSMMASINDIKVDGDLGIFPKGSASTDIRSPYNFAIITGERNGVPVTEFWILINAWYDYDAQRFKRFDLDNFSFGWQLQGGGTYPGEETIGDFINQGVNLWKANGRKAFSEGDPMRDQITEIIGTTIGGTWTEFGVILGWNNLFMCDSYGGMTIGGSGFEIDGSGTYPYIRISFGKYNGGSADPDREAEDYTFAYNGNLWNSYHGMFDRDDNSIPGFFWGMTSPIDFDHSGTHDPNSNRAKLEGTSWVWRKLPANAENKIENWADIIHIKENGEGTMGGRVMTTSLTIDAPIEDDVNFNVGYPDGTWTKENTVVIGVKGVKSDGSIKQTTINATLTDFGIFGTVGEAFVSMKLVLSKH